MISVFIIARGFSDGVVPLSVFNGVGGNGDVLLIRALCKLIVISGESYTN